MNYQKVYDQLIERAKNRNLECYVERHHIIPRCMGGNDSKDNLVELTPEEHYIAHQLLVKIYPKNHSLIRAAVMMIPKRPSNKMYGWLRRKFSEAQSDSQSGEGNSNFGKIWITDGVISKTIFSTDDVPKGWRKGRIVEALKGKRLKLPLHLRSSVNLCRKCSDIKKNEAGKNRAEILYRDFVSSNLTIHEFARKNADVKGAALSRLFSRHLSVEDKNKIRGGLT